MKEKLAEFVKKHFVNYKKLYIKQNEEIDKMRSDYEKRKRNLEKEIDEKVEHIDFLNKSLIEEKQTSLTYKDKYEKLYIQFKEVSNQHTKEFIKFTKTIDSIKKAKRKIASSNGGLHTKILAQQKIINNFEKENQDIKNLLQKVVKESGRKLTPPTIQELNNYNLFGNKGGIKNAKNRNNISESK